MPWVDVNNCTGCKICVQKCPVGAISLQDKKAKINMDKCIRCGRCHQVCPKKAVKHDSLKIPEEVGNNVKKTISFMKLCAQHFKDSEEADKCLERMIKYFNKEKAVAEKTLEEIEKLKGGIEEWN
ncbi:MAG: 4Fe-4S binding protein [Candidatus Omnitrophica bacterium]|nr:4Fe-4S binding protein [Candidatus Omnitrophota bacterium]MDD5429876.1 4Fe-4S binding protein [Candidatus Omnitrophota bacterium]